MSFTAQEVSHSKQNKRRKQHAIVGVGVFMLNNLNSRLKTISAEKLTESTRRFSVIVTGNQMKHTVTLCFGLGLSIAVTI